MRVISSQQVCQVLLSFASRAAGRVHRKFAQHNNKGADASSTVESNEVSKIKNSPYAIDCTADTFAHILTLLDLNSEVLVNLLDDVNKMNRYSDCDDDPLFESLEAKEVGM